VAAVAVTIEASSRSDLEAAVGERMGLDRSEVNQLLRWKDLPAKWQERVRTYEQDRENDNGLPWSCAKAILPYAHVPVVMDALETVWKQDWNRDRLQRKDSIRSTLQGIAEHHTRPLDKSRRHDYGWQNGGRQSRLYPLDADLREKLQVEKLPLGPKGKPVEVITNTKLNDELMQPFLKKIAAKNNGRQTNDKPKAAKKKELTPAEERAKHADQDRQLAERIQREGGFAEQALRLAIGNALHAGHWATEGLYDDLISTSRESNGSSSLDLKAWRYEAQQILRIGRGDTAKRHSSGLYCGCEQYAEYSLGSLNLEDDPLSDVQQIRVLVCSLLLWPEERCAKSDRLVAVGEYPERLVWIVPSVLQTWAERMGVGVKDTWSASALPGRARVWLRAFFEAHNRRQLRRLAGDLYAMPALDGCKTGKDDVEGLLKWHSGKPALALPACLTTVKQRKGKK
jgi:hypothetical protein